MFMLHQEAFYKIDIRAWVEYNAVQWKLNSGLVSEFSVFMEKVNLNLFIILLERI